MRIQAIRPSELPLLEALLDLFGRAFDEEHTYGASRPDPAYQRRLLASDTFLALVALEALDGVESVVGGLCAYELRKFEQARSELYIYDLAVDASHRRQGIATALIERLREMAEERGAWVIFVQADRDDAPAVALYESLGKREEVLHFDIRPSEPRGR